MARNGNGVYSLAQPAFTPGITISSSAVNSDLSDIASALTQSISADGQTTITGQLKFPNGTAAAPAFSFAGDLTTGMYYLGTGHLGFSAGGTAIVAFNANNFNPGHAGDIIEINSPTGIVYPNPVGMVTDFAGITGLVPAGWLLCYGQVLNVSSYPELFAALGSTNTFGGNGTTTFGIPDCRGRTSYGQDNMGGVAANRITVAGGNFDGTVLGGVGGGQSQTLTQAQLPAVAPTFTGTPQTPTLNNVTGANMWDGSIGFNAGGGGTAVAAAAGFNTAGNRGQTVTVTPAGTISNLGSGNSHPILGPAIIFNKIIFAGRV